jgi:hypothetical protein
MWGHGSGAHAGPMFGNFDITEKLVTEKQRELRREASRDRLARLARRGRQARPSGHRHERAGR